MQISDGFPHENEQTGPEPVSPACFRAFVGFPSKAVRGKINCTSFYLWNNTSQTSGMSERPKNEYL